MTTNLNIDARMNRWPKIALGLLLVTVAIALALSWRHIASADTVPASDTRAEMYKARAAVAADVIKKAPQLTANAGNSSVVDALISLGSSTYRPGVQRPVRVSHGVDIFDDAFWRNKKNWRLYAQSEKEAQWLDQYGYPTPTEEARLEAMSDADLDRLAAAGDMNALVHAAVRLARASMSSTNPRAAIVASATLDDAMRKGGPYQAYYARKGISDILTEYLGTPASLRTETQLQALSQFVKIQQQSIAVGWVYRDAITAIGGEDDLFLITKRVPALASMEKDIEAWRLADFLVGAGAWRTSPGRPPLVINPRPHDVTLRTGTIFERY